jgi:hypothetical protein
MGREHKAFRERWRDRKSEIVAQHCLDLICFHLHTPPPPSIPPDKGSSLSRRGAVFFVFWEEWVYGDRSGVGEIAGLGLHVDDNGGLS